MWCSVSLSCCYRVKNLNTLDKTSEKTIENSIPSDTELLTSKDEIIKGKDVLIQGTEERNSLLEEIILDLNKTNEHNLKQRRTIENNMTNCQGRRGCVHMSRRS